MRISVSSLTLPVLLLAAVAAGAMPPPPPPAVVVLKAARAFVGNGDGLMKDAVVIVEGTTIRDVGSNLPVPEGAKVVDLGDVTLLPGIIDCHTHLSGESSDSWLRDTVDGMRRSTAEAAIRATDNARRTVLAGVTTVRDLGSSESIDVGLRNAIRDGRAVGPRMLVAYYSLGARGGHCDETGYPYMRFGYETGVERGIAAGPEGFRDAVRFAVKYGADVIKVCATGGVLSLADEVDTCQLTQAEMDALVDEAHRLRKRVAAHAHGVDGARVAVKAGVDSIEHGSFLDEATFRMMKERGTYLVPTLLAGEYVAGKAVERSYPPEIAAKAKAAVEARTGAVRLAVKMGVKIAFGTDSAVSPHGMNGQEFALMVDHGMSPAAALRAATSVAAELLGIGKKVGTLEAGKAADVIAVPGDPLADIHAMERVSFVMAGGDVVKGGAP